MKRLSTSNFLGVRLLLLITACAAAAAGAGFLVSRKQPTNWLIPQMTSWGGLSLGIMAAGLLLVSVWFAGRISRSISLLRQRIVTVIAGDLAAPDPNLPRASELIDLHVLFGQMLEQLRQARLEQFLSQQSLADRTKTVDRLWEFSQTIQGAGRFDQIFPTLCHFLVHELGLSGVAVLSHDSENSPAILVRASLPDGLFNGPPIEFDAALCPCLRQSQPRRFRPGDSPVRCTVERYLTVLPSHEAYCIPFGVGRSAQFVIHMLLPPGQSWAEQGRQLAQTYVNTAQSTLTSLHLLAEAEKQSMTDSLTGLYNRRSLDALLHREVALAERHQQPLSVVMIDMDCFKQINDAHGHAAGDHMLRAFADCVRITLRKTDLAFRYGGDEFVIALPQTPVAQAQQVMQKLREAFGSVDFSSAIANLQVQPSLSIGVAERSAAMNLLTLPALLSAADQALYDAKSISRNCIRIYQPPRAA